jgi:hypothetical protein
MSRESLFRHPSMSLLRRAIRREQAQKLLASAALLAFGGTLCYAFFALNIPLTVIGLVCAVLGLRYTAYFLTHRRIEDSPLLRLLKHQPGQIVWVYSLVTEWLPFGLQMGRNATLYFKLLDGDEITLGIPQKDLKLVSHLLNRLLPHASFGYTRDREQWYLASPAMLLQDEPEEEG